MRWTLALAALTGLLFGCKSETTFTPKDNFVELDSDHGQWLSMAVAPDGTPTMSFYDVTFGGVGFAKGSVFEDQIRWSYERVDGYPDSEGLNAGDLGKFTDMAFGSDGTAWISYHTNKKGGLKVAHRVGRDWEAEMVDPGTGLSPMTGMWTSVAVDVNDQPVVVYHDHVGGTLNMAQRSDSGWTTQVIYEGKPYSGTDADGNPVERPALVGEFANIHIEGNTHYITFYDAAQQELVLLEGFGGAYVPTVVDTDGDVGQWSSISIEGDHLAIAYHDVGNQHLKLAQRTGGGRFEVSTIDERRWVGADTAIYRTESGIGVVYFDAKNSDVQLSKQVDSTWSAESISGTENATGFFNEVVTDGAGRTWAGYYDQSAKIVVTKRLQ